jgi:hypothetical protein
MKRHLNILIAIVMLFGILATTARAQMTGGQRLIANIPFAFYVGGKTLPAGRYTITILSSTSDRQLLQLRSVDGRSTAMVVTIRVNGKVSEKTRLAFRRYGDQYFFGHAQLSGDQTTLAALKSGAERAQQRAIGAQKNSVLTIVTEER